MLRIYKVVVELSQLIAFVSISQLLVTFKHTEAPEDPDTELLFNVELHFNGPDFTANTFPNDGELPPFEKYSQNFVFNDTIERMFYQLANSTKGFMYDFEFENYTNYDEKLNVDHVAFIILGCKKLSHRLKSQLQTWLSFTRHYYFAVDSDIFGIPNVVVLHQSLCGGANTYVSAGERHWHSMLWFMEQSELLTKLKWIVLIDDDTWMNVPKLLDFLSRYNYKYNLGIGQVFHEFITKNRTFLQGGSGMVFSQTAFVAVTKQLFKPWCRYNKHGDLSLWSCYKVAGTLLVHSDKFHQWSVPYDKLGNSYMIKPQDYLNQISFHYMNNHLVSMKMTCDVAEYWKYPEPTDCKEMRLATNNSFYLRLPLLTFLRYSFFEPGPSSGGVPDH